MNDFLLYITCHLNKIRNTSNDVQKDLEKEKEIRKRIQDFENSVHGKYIKLRSMSKHNKYWIENSRPAHKESDFEKIKEENYDDLSLRIHEKIHENIKNTNDTSSKASSKNGSVLSMSEDSLSAFIPYSQSGESSQGSSKVLYNGVASYPSLESNRSSCCSQNVEYDKKFMNNSIARHVQEFSGKGSDL